jgi:hypothetical protein
MGMHSVMAQHPAQSLLAQVPPQPSGPSWHLPVQSGMQSTQPSWVHSLPTSQTEPVAAQTQAPWSHESERSSAVQSTQMDPFAPQLVGDGSLQALPSQQPSGQVLEVQSVESSPQDVIRNREQAKTDRSRNLMVRAPWSSFVYFNTRILSWACQGGFLVK